LEASRQAWRLWRGLRGGLGCFEEGFEGGLETIRGYRSSCGEQRVEAACLGGRGLSLEPLYEDRARYLWALEAVALAAGIAQPEPVGDFRERREATECVLRNIASIAE